MALKIIGILVILHLMTIRTYSEAQSYLGDEFILVYPDLDGNRVIPKIGFANPLDSSVTVTYWWPGLAAPTVSSLGGEQSLILQLDEEALQSPSSKQVKQGVHIWAAKSSQQDGTRSFILVKGIQGEQSNLAIPTSSLGSSYSAPSCPIEFEDFTSVCIVSIVAAENDTSLTIKLNNVSDQEMLIFNGTNGTTGHVNQSMYNSSYANPASDPIFFSGKSYEPGGSIAVELSTKGDALQLNSERPAAFGLVEASANIAVVVGCTIIPKTGEIVEGDEADARSFWHQLTPIDIWGKRFALAPPDNSGATLRLDIKGSMVNSSISIRHEDKERLLYLDENHHVMTDFSPLRADKPIYVLTEQPAQVFYYIITSQVTRMVSVPPMEQYNDQYQVSTPDNEQINGVFITRVEIPGDRLMINSEAYKGTGGDNWLPLGVDGKETQDGVSWTTIENAFTMSRFRLKSGTGGREYSFSLSGEVRLPFGLFLYKGPQNKYTQVPTNMMLQTSWEDMTKPSPAEKPTVTPPETSWNSTDDPTNSTDRGNATLPTTPGIQSSPRPTKSSLHKKLTAVVLVTVLCGVPLTIVLVLACKAYWQSRNEKKVLGWDKDSDTTDIIPMTTIGVEQSQTNGDELKPPNHNVDAQESEA